MRHLCWLVVLFAVGSSASPSFGAEIDGVAPVAVSTYHAIGSASTASAASARLAHIELTANERAAKFHGLVISSTGLKREVEAIGYMVPEVGWVIQSNSSGAHIAVSAGAPTAVDFTVSGVSGTVQWVGVLDIVFTQNYAP